MGACCCCCCTGLHPRRQPVRNQHWQAAAGRAQGHHRGLVRGPGSHTAAHCAACCAQLLAHSTGQPRSCPLRCLLRARPRPRLPPCARTPCVPREPCAGADARACRGASQARQGGREHAVCALGSAGRRGRAEWGRCGGGPWRRRPALGWPGKAACILQFVVLMSCFLRARVLWGGRQGCKVHLPLWGSAPACAQDVRNQPAPAPHWLCALGAWPATG